MSGALMDSRNQQPKKGVCEMHGYWKKPALHRSIEGGDLLLGPLQINWYNHGLRVHFTWPFRDPRTVTLWQKP